MPTTRFRRLRGATVSLTLTLTAAVMTASLGGVVKSASLEIGQLAPSIEPASIPGGLPATGIVTLPIPAPDHGASIA